MNAIRHSEKLNSTKAEFDKLAAGYEKNRLSGWYKASNQMLLHLIAKTACESVLDIGCATGWLLRQLKKENLIRHGVGIDLSSQMVRSARDASEKEKTTGLEFINADWEKFEIDALDNKKFDAVICAHTLHYFTHPIGSIERMRRCLSDDGTVYFIERDTTGSAITRIWIMVHEWILRDRVRFYSARELKNMMVKAGFTYACRCKTVKRLFWKKKMYTSLVILQGSEKQ